jgi:hypothetical protein
VLGGVEAASDRLVEPAHHLELGTPQGDVADDRMVAGPAVGQKHRRPRVDDAQEVVAPVEGQLLLRDHDGRAVVRIHQVEQPAQGPGRLPAVVAVDALAQQVVRRQALGPLVGREEHSLGRELPGRGRQRALDRGEIAAVRGIP